jgi:hypothetical protein
MPQFLYPLPSEISKEGTRRRSRLAGASLPAGKNCATEQELFKKDQKLNEETNQQ